MREGLNLVLSVSTCAWFDAEKAVDKIVGGDGARLVGREVTGRKVMNSGFWALNVFNLSSALLAGSDMAEKSGRSGILACSGTLSRFCSAVVRSRS